MGKVVNTREWLWTEEAAITPPNSATGKPHFIIPGPTTAHNNPNLVPAVRCRVLDPYCLSDIQPGKGVGVLVVLELDLISTGGCTAVTVLRFGLPFL